MARAKGNKNNGAFSLYHHALFASAHYFSLSPVARCVLHGMFVQYNGKNNGELTATAKQAKHWGFSEPTLIKALKELEENRFITKVKQGLFASGRHNYNLFALTWINLDVGGSELKPTKEPLKTTKQIIEGD